ncbi:filamentous hemagglutinin N-terminal domain-containing protein, partial [Aliikangiella marina]
MVANFVQGMRESASKVVKSSFTMPKDVSCLSRVSAQVCFALSLAISAPLHAEDIDMPIGGRIIEGEGSIIESGLLTTIQQNSNALIVDWDTFDIGINGRVDFIQPGANAIALNRIFDNKPSEIFGQLNSNGHIVLLNSYGILFGETASVNVGGLVATSLSISAEDFMNGDYVFSDLGEVSGSIINHGLINAATGGNVTLLGGRVENHGLIAANLGAVNLAAGREAVLTFDNQGLLGVKVTESVLQEDLGVDPAVINTGDINAAGGSILLTASASQDIFSQAVQVGDMAEAREAIINEDGSFTLTSRSNAQINTGSGNQLTAGADVVNSGSLDVSTDEEGEDAGEIQIVGENVTNSGVLLANAENGNGGAIAVESRDVTLVTDNSVISTRAENGLGGEIRILGDKVGVLDETVIDSSGRNGGGDILIGGDFQGSNSAIRNASRTYVGDDTEIYADALNEGDGGTVILWSDELTYFGGNIYTRGGQTAGDGGFVEISGKEQLLFRGETDRSAVNGVGGTLLLDPRDITIGTNNDDGGQISDNEVLFTDGGASEDFSISAAQIVAELVDGDVLLQAFRDLEVDSAIIANAGNTNNLTLQAGDDLRINAAIDLIAGDLSLMAGISCGTCSDLGADLVIDSTLNTSGSISLEAARDVFISAAIGGSAAPSSITVRAGDDINLNSGSSLTSAGNMVLTAADSSLVADGFWAVSSASGDINFNGGNITTNGGNFTASTEDGNFDFNTGDISTGGGDFSATTADGTIDINGNDIDTNGGAFLFSSSGDLDLDSGDITSNGGTINIRSSAGAVTLNGSNINSNTGDVLFSAEGNIEFRDGLVTTSGGNFVANSASGYFDNAFSNSDAIDAGAGSVTITSGGSYSVSGVGVYLGRITAGSLSVTTTGGSISQYTFAGQYLEINGTTTLNAGANSITLDVTDNEINGPIILTNTGANAVLINNSVDTTLGAVNVGGNLTIDSQQGLSLTDDLTVVGNAVFDFAQNNSNGNVFNVDTGLTIATGSLTVNGGTGNDQFDIGSDIGGQLNGDDGIDTFNILADVVTTTIDGGGGSDILVGNDSVNTNTWVVDSDNSGTLTNSSNVVSFSNLENLQGGSGVDTFTVTANLSSLDAGNGNNNITINNGGDVTGAVTAGDGDDTILLEDSTASAIVGSIDAGNGNNNITINNFGSVTGAIVTGTGIDTIVFTGNGTAGSLSTGAGDDVITIVDNSSVSGLIDGGADNDSVTITGSDVTITLGTDVANTETLTA